MTCGTKSKKDVMVFVGDQVCIHLACVHTHTQQCTYNLPLLLHVTMHLASSSLNNNHTKKRKTTQSPLKHCAVAEDNTDTQLCWIYHGHSDSVQKVNTGELMKAQTEWLNLLAVYILHHSALLSFHHQKSSLLFPPHPPSPASTWSLYLFSASFPLSATSCLMTGWHNDRAVRSHARTSHLFIPLFVLFIHLHSLLLPPRHPGLAAVVNLPAPSNLVLIHHLTPLFASLPVAHPCSGKQQLLNNCSEEEIFNAYVMGSLKHLSHSLWKSIPSS